jgi:hypothetical protein
MRTPLTLLIAAAFIMPCTLLAQTRNSKDSVALLTHGWTLTTMVFDGKTQVMPYGKMPLLDLKKDGTLILPDPVSPQTVHWMLLPKTQYLVLDKPYKILKLDEKTLVLADVEDEGKMYLTRR